VIAVLRRLVRHRAGFAGGVIVLIFLTAGVAAPVVSPFDPLRGDLIQARQPPSLVHPFGTDELGRDVLSRVLHASVVSLRAGAAAVAIAITVGVPIGLAAGYFGGLVDTLSQRLIDAVMAFPGILLAILVVSVLGARLESTTLAIALVSIPTYARLARGSVLTQRALDYVTAARALGASHQRIISKHILPNITSPVIVQSSLQFALAILSLAGLSFIGLGAQPPTPEWGSMLSQGHVYIRTAPHMVIFPGLAIWLTVLGLNLLGDALRDALDPQEWLSDRSVRGNR
jgi:peptide/nickel transport system permease protein